MKQKICAVLFIGLSISVYANEWVVQYYIPSFFGLTSGVGGLLYDFKDTDTINDSFIIPLEAKIHIINIGNFGFSVNGGASLYLQNSAFGSINLTAGISSYNSAYPLEGLFISFYPIYEFPVTAIGKEPVFNWKMAMDILGFSFNFDPSPVYASGYFRSIFFYIGKNWAAVMDFGLTVGIYLGNKK
jgi:hypothetical protein